MSRAIIYLYASKEDEFINLEADEIKMTDDNVIILRNGKVCGIFALTEVRAAYISQKRGERNV